MQDTIEIMTLEGLVRGAADGGFAAHHRAPFSERPNGPLRFKPTLQVKARVSTLDAKLPNSLCPELPSRLAQLSGAGDSSKDLVSRGGG